MPRPELIDKKRALSHLMDLLAVEGLSGRESKVAALVRKKLQRVVPTRAWMMHDRAHERIGRGFEIGNLIVKLDGNVRGPRRLFSGARGNSHHPKSRTGL